MDLNRNKMRVFVVMAVSMMVFASRVAGESQEYCDENGCYYSDSYSSEDCYSSQGSGSVDDGSNDDGYDSNDDRYGGNSYQHGSVHKRGGRYGRGRGRGDETNTYNYNYNYYGNSDGYDNYDSGSAETQAPETTTTTTQAPETTTTTTQRPKTTEWAQPHGGGSRYRSGQVGIGIGGLGNLLRLPGEIASGVLGGERGIGISSNFGYDNSVSGRGSVGSSGSFGSGLKFGIGI